MLADADAPPRAGAGVVPPVVAPGALMAKVVTEMPSAQRAKLGGLTFRDLVGPPSPKAKGGKADAAEVGKALPRLLIRHLEDFAAGAGERLQRECPDFYSSEDVKVAEAHKLLAEARRLRSPPRLTGPPRLRARGVAPRPARRHRPCGGGVRSARRRRVRSRRRWSSSTARSPTVPRGGGRPTRGCGGAAAVGTAAAGAARRARRDGGRPAR